MSRKEKLLLDALLVVGAILFAAGLIALLVVGAVLFADEVAAAPSAAPSVQAGRVVIDPDGGTQGMADIQFDFDAPPVVVATLSDQVPVRYVYARAFSGVAGAIVIELEEPADYPITVNWVATMATDGAAVGATVEEGR